MDMKQTYLYDILIIGSGVAGLTSALQLDKNLRIAIISKSSLQGGASWLAQGGIAAVFDERTIVQKPMLLILWPQAQVYVMRNQSDLLSRTALR